MSALTSGKRAAALALLSLAVAFYAQGQSQKAALSVERAEELARSSASAVAAAAASATAALRAVDQARASFFPQISGSASGAYLVNPPDGVTIKAGSLGTLPLWVPASSSPGQYYSGPFTEYEVTMPSEDIVVVDPAKSTYFKGNVTFTQPIYAWGKIRAALDLASLESRVASIRASGAALDAARQADAAYFSALLARRSSSILAELAALASEIVADRTKALDGGLATKEQLLSSTADLAAVTSQLVQANEGEKSALEALSALTGVDAASMELSSEFRDRLPTIDEAGLQAAAPAFSTSYGEAQTRLAEAKKKVDLAWGSSLLLPDAAFFASLDTSGQDIPYAVDSWTDTWDWDLSLGLSIKVDFFDGGAARARKRGAEADRQAAAVGLEAEGKALRLEVRKAVEAGRRAEAALASASAKADWAAEALRVARANAAAQMISRSELDGAAIREATARLELLSARYALEQAAADLDRLEGAR